MEIGSKCRDEKCDSACKKQSKILNIEDKKKKKKKKKEKRKKNARLRAFNMVDKFRMWSLNTFL